MTKQLRTLAALALLASLFASPQTFGADLIKGYNRGANDPLQLGSSFIVDEAATGGGDFTDNTAPGFPGWVTQYTDFWTPGTEVSITGLAIPIHANDTNLPNSSAAGNFTFTFFDLSGGPNANAFDGYDFMTMTGEPVLGQVTATFDPGAGNQTDEYYLNFDTPLNFTAQSTGLAFHVWSSETLRLKINNAGGGSRGVRVGLGDGVPVGGTNSHFRATLAGSPVALPPPGVEHRFVASLDVPGNRVWEPVDPSQERFVFRNPQPGDFNGDGFTNAADYTLWRDNNGGDESLLAPGSRAPGATGPINGSDYSHWASNYGSPTSVPVNDPSVPGITAAFRGGAIGAANVFETVLNGQQVSRQDGSFELWFKPDSLSGGDQLLYEVGGTGAGSYISLQDDQLSVFVKSAFAGNDQTVSTTLTNDGWTQVVAVIHNTYDASLPSADDFVDLYVNGVLAATSISVSDVNDWAGGNQAGLGTIGGSFASGGPLTDPGDGGTSLDLKGEIAIFEYVPSALTATDVANRYAAITSAAALATPEPGAMVLAGVCLVGALSGRRS